MLDLLPPNLRRHLLQVGDLKKLRAGEAVEVQSGYVIVLSGKVFVLDADGNLLLGYLAAGDILGVGNFPVKLCGWSGEVLLVGEEDFRVVLERSPEVIWRVIGSIIGWAGKVSELAVRLAKLRAASRVALAILDFDGRVSSVSLVAKRAGVSRETASRIINRWVRRGVVGRVEGKLVVLKPERLQAEVKWP
jgi:CRP-like cAMP-binding protein